CRVQQIAAHRWGSKPGRTYPSVPGAAWAACAPVVCDVETDGEFAIYLSGSTAPASNPGEPLALPEDHLALLAVVACIVQSVRKLHDLKHCRSGMQEFFPKPIRDLILRHGPAEVFKTEQAQAAVLFCDLRGSSKFAEKQAGDLLSAWERIKAALSVMTEAITNQYGSIGDFQGDAAMGFWGWPHPDQSGGRLADSVKAACQAADTLRERFLQKSLGHGPLADFACGIGIAAGPVVAGMLGTDDQRKIGVFGPVVNLAARLESMTKQIGASILLDQRCYDVLAETESPLADRIRFIAAIQPAGMGQAVRVYELMLPASNSKSLPGNLVKLYEVAQEAFVRGDWREARKALQKPCQADDGPAKFLLKHIEERQTPPANWDGRVVLTSK
ncbi:MAG: adenylate/guanylate cyclase domain-containing protein, partial [Pirellulaceae bacterium]|nr:adenylate/guanylate cyclase domain-containing protein [Pirellulaceae bacterium]